MTTKVNGAAYPGVWVERQVAFVKLTFNTDISAIPAADLFELGTTTPVSLNTVADSTFGIVESAIVLALKTVETRSTVLAISTYDATTFSIDVMLGNAEGWFAPLTDGVIVSALPVGAATAMITTAGSSATDAVGTLVSVNPSFVTVSVNYVYMDGSMPSATGANGALSSGPGSTSGAYPMNSPTGTPGFYPAAAHN